DDRPRARRLIGRARCASRRTSLLPHHRPTRPIPSRPDHLTGDRLLQPNQTILPGLVLAIGACIAALWVRLTKGGRTLNARARALAVVALAAAVMLLAPAPTLAQRAGEAIPVMPGAAVPAPHGGEASLVLPDLRNTT